MSEGVTAVTKEMAIIWDMMLSDLAEVRRYFGVNFPFRVP
jgi:hypothetical protein